MSFRGIDVREAGDRICSIVEFLDENGDPVTSGTGTVRYYELQSDGTLKSYDFDDNTFKTAALTTATASLTHRTGNNSTKDTGLWTRMQTTLTGFSAGNVYLEEFEHEDAVPPIQHRWFQYGSGVLADVQLIEGQDPETWIEAFLATLESEDGSNSPFGGPLVINEWKGDTPAEFCVVELTVAEAIPGLLYRVSFPGETDALYRAEADDTAPLIAAGLADALRDWTAWRVSYTEGETVITLTAREAGIPTWRGLEVFNPPSSYVERVRAGVKPVSQQIDIILPATTSGGTWSLSLDFGSGAETASTLAHNITPSALATAVNGLATPTALGGGAAVVLLSSSPRTYRLTLGGDLATGTNATASASGAGLSGNASVTIETIQEASASDATEIQAIFFQVSSGSIGGQKVRFRLGTGQWTEFTGSSITGTSGGLDAEEQIQELIDGLVGEGVCTASLYIGYQAAVVVLAFNDQTTRATINGGMDGSSWVAETHRLREAFAESKNELQVVTIGSNTGYTLTFDGDTTSSLTPATSSLATILSALEGLTSIGSSNVQVYSANFGIDSIAPKGAYIVEFKGALDETDQPEMTISAGTDNAVDTVADGGPVVTKNEIQQIEIIAEGGTFTLDFDGDDTSALDYDLSASDLDTALEGLDGIDPSDLTTLGSNGIFTVEFGGSLEATDVPLMIADPSSLLGGKPVSVSTVTSAVAGVNEVQMVVIDSRASGGTLRAGFGIAFTDDLSYDAGTSDWETALEGLATIGANNLSVDGDPGTLLVEFIGDLGESPQELIVLDQDDLVTPGEGALRRTVEAFGDGPETYSLASNWSREHVPTTGETVVFGSGKQPCLYGLLQRTEFTVDGDGSPQLHIGECDLVDGQKVRLRTTDTLPTCEDSEGSPVSVDDETDLYVVGVDRVGKTMLLSDAADGEPLLWQTAGTGTHTVEVQLAGIQASQRFTGTVGLPRRRRDGGYEWLPRYLQVGLLPAVSFNCELGLGSGGGSNRMQFDFSGTPASVLLLNSGRGTDVPAALLILDHEDSSLDVIGGEVGLALEADESGSMGRLNMFGGRAVIGNMTIESIRNYNLGAEVVRAAADQSLIVTQP